MDKFMKNSFCLLFILLLVSIGYALLSSNLSINGTSTISNALWDIHFENIQVASGSVTPTSAAAINASGDKVTYSVVFNTPGDFYEFTVDVKNAGTIDGMIESVSSTINNQPISSLPSYLEYSLTYEDGVEVQNNYKLPAGRKDTYKIHIGFKRDINPSDLPNSNQSYNLSFGINGIQANSNATNRPMANFYYIGRQLNIGAQNPYNSYVYSNYEDAISAFGHPAFIKHVVTNDLIAESYVAFIYNNNVYYLKPLGGSFDDYGYCIIQSPYYETNKAVLENAFGSSNCNESTLFGEKSFICSNGGLSARAVSCGLVMVEDSTFKCSAVYNGTSGCDLK